ncbi:AAA family ATPase [Stenotrophomonas sp. STM01]|uniref:AAA family ATPase n=1 Tax=Stenotrophomonas sp. STM01 TaxID=2769278 RepID=UPI00177CB0F7|nr:AAA family ATPase [Stenotrophomonas sp. STM01]MBD9537158.1 AAA family ATPase [Stenotrophomonas sp. STM01]
MSAIVSSNFAFLSNQEPLLHQIATAAEASFYSDSNVTLVKLRQLAEHLTRNAAARLGIASGTDESFFSLIASLKSRIDVDEKVTRLLHHLRKSGNEAVHEYRHDQVEAERALRSAREACIWYYRTFCSPHPTFKPGLFIKPRDWKQEEGDLRAEIARLKVELEERRNDSEKSRELVRSLKEQEDRLHAIVNERTFDAEASLALAEEQEKKLQSLAAEYEERLAEIAHRMQWDDDAATTISERSRQAGKHVQAEWAPEIRLRDAFDRHHLTANQESLVLDLEAFLVAKNEHVFILSGHAGTGKTFITKGLSEFLAAAGRQCVLTAPTGKAARVITQKSGRTATTIHKKIYSMDDIREYKVDDLDGSETYKLYAELEVNNDADNTVYVVDESSMVSDVYSEGEFFRFGSGKLLSDLIKYVNLDHNDHAKKVIFIGDAAQLPPVGMNSSPALDQRYLAKTFGVTTIRRFELSEVVRQDADSGILSSANTLRDSLSKKIFNKLALATDAPDVQTCPEADDIVTGYLTASGNKVSDVAMIIASSNADVASFNEQVRRRLFPDNKYVTQGDKLVVVMNCVVDGNTLNNGDLVYVTRVGDVPDSRSVTLRNKNKSTGKVEETEVTLRFRDVQIGFRLPSGEVVRANVKIVESLLYSGHPNLNSDESKALYIDFRRRNPHLPKGGKELRDALRDDPYFNALRVKFGYALTCHKSQGSEWADVFVQCKTHHANPRTEEYFRWLYTAITRASKRVHLLNPPHFRPWHDFGGAGKPGQPRPATPLSNPDPDAPATEDSVPPPVPPSEPDLARSDIAGESTPAPRTGDLILDGIYHAVSNRLADMAGVRIERIDHHAWQEAYYISDGTRFTRINIAYNGKGIAGSIMPVPRDEFGLEIADRLSGIKGRQFHHPKPPNAQESRFTRDVFNEFFPVFSKAAVSNGLQIIGVTEEAWNLRLVLASGTTRGELAIYCDGKGRINKHAWIGRPPQDPSLHQVLDATMANL